MSQSSDNSGLWGLLATRWASGESRIQENWTHGPRSKFAVPLLQALALLIGLLAGVGSIALMLQALTAAGQAHAWTGWRVARFCAGLCGLPTAVVLSWHMVHELVVPFWRVSPFEKQIAPAIVDMLEGTRRGDAGDVRRIVPYRVSGELTAISGQALDAVDVAREDARLLDFLALAAELRAEPTRRAMGAEGRGRYMLRQSGERLGRELYDAIVAELEEPWQFVRRGRRSHATEWLVDPVRAYRIMSRELLERGA